jgi:hypothetical protein
MAEQLAASQRKTRFHGVSCYFGAQQSQISGHVKRVVENINSLKNFILRT